MIRYKIFIVTIFLCVFGCSAHIRDGIHKDYYKTGILKSVRSYRNGALNGISREYYAQGTLKHAVNYKNNRVDGMYHTYYPSGALWTNEIYHNGTIISRKEYNEEGEIIKEENFYGN